MSHLSLEKETLQKTATLLRAKLEQTQAQLRNTQRTIRAKRHFLARAHQTLHTEFSDTFDIRPYKRRNRHVRIPAGLVPLLPHHRPYHDSLDTERDTATLALTACEGWVRGEAVRHVWVRLTLHNTTQQTLVQAHIHIDLPSAWMAETHVRNEQCTVPAGHTTVLYAAWELPEHLTADDLQPTLRVACRYTREQDPWEWKITSAVGVQWHDSSSQQWLRPIQGEESIRCPHVSVCSGVSALPLFCWSVFARGSCHRTPPAS
ncbi:hypothetical protein BDF14DRAFT_1754523 [Spinellus fusiger]|nr:hypothetical protein BDF14DRAFT_1754523 [Spinellus fusiger]